MRLDMTIPDDLNDALDSVVRVSGVSKAALVRRAIGQLMVEYNALPPHAIAHIDPTPSTAPLASERERKNR